MLLRSERDLAYVRLLMNSPSSLLRSSVLSASVCYFFIGATATTYRTLGNQLDLKDDVLKVARCDARDCREKPPLPIFQFHLNPIFRGISEDAAFIRCTFIAKSQDLTRLAFLPRSIPRWWCECDFSGCARCQSFFRQPDTHLSLISLPVQKGKNLPTLALNLQQIKPGMLRARMKLTVVPPQRFRQIVSPVHMPKYEEQS